MLTRFAVILAAALAIPTAVTAQHGSGSSSQPAATAPREAAQFDFLIGQWELVARPRASTLAARIHGAPTLSGTWKGWRALDGWGFEDEMKLVDGSGNPRAFVHTVRVYSSAAKRWTTSTLDVARASFVSATAEWRDGHMLVSASGSDQDGKPFVSRTRFYDITRDRFRVQQDRSYDNGRTWTEGVLKIDAKRVSATASR